MTSLAEVALVAFTTFFATIGPIDVAAVFAGLTAGHSPQQRRRLALKGSAIALGVLLVFALFGETLLARLGISLPALRTAGGILLLLMAIDMVFARPRRFPPRPRAPWPSARPWRRRNLRRPLRAPALAARPA